MIVVGLTGGIGSGKTTVAKMFIELGIPVYFSDNEAKRLMNTSRAIKRKLLAEFGDEAYKDGKLNRTYLASIVFNDKDKLQAINRIVHPSVGNSFKRWIRKQKSPYVIQENAILFENNKESQFNYIITVTAPLEEKIERVIKRDAVTEEQVLARINNQLPDKEKIKNSNFVIENISIEHTKQQVQNVHEQLLKLARAPIS